MATRGNGSRTMAKRYAKAFYESEQWRKCRLGYIRHRRGIDGGICEECGERIGYIVHHMEYITPQNINDAEVTLNWDNLAYVCIPCHNQIHELRKFYKYRKKSKNERLYFDKDGNPQPRVAPL